MVQIWLQRGDRRPSQAEGAVLKGKAHQAGDHVIEADQFGSAVRTFDPDEDFGWVFVLMDADVKRSLSGDPDLLYRAVIL